MTELLPNFGDGRDLVRNAPPINKIARFAERGFYGISQGHSGAARPTTSMLAVPPRRES